MWSVRMHLEYAMSLFKWYILTRLHIDDGKTRALKSWWPLVRYWEKGECGHNSGRWTKANEDWYLGRLRAIEAKEGGKNQPLSYTEWKSKMHGVGAVRKFHKSIEDRSHQVLEETCTINTHRTK
jgi:hypothetical protein